MLKASLPGSTVAPLTLIFYTAELFYNETTVTFKVIVMYLLFRRQISEVANEILCENNYLKSLLSIQPLDDFII